MIRNIAISVAGIFIISCTTGESNKNVSTVKTSSKMQKSESTVVYDSITNVENQTLFMSFDKAKKTATFIFESDTMIMKQDTMGSGIKYSNDLFQFTEWHGEGELKKDSVTIFKYNRR